MTNGTGGRAQRLRCAVLDDYQGVALDFGPWETLTDRVEVVPFSDHLSDREALAERLAGFDIVVAMRERTPLDRALLERLPRLKLLVTTGMRNAAIDIKAASERGITVCGTGSASHAPVEITFALILALARHIPAEAAALRSSGPWQSTVGADLEGARLGVVGLGRLGGRVAAIARAFGMRVGAWSANLTEERCAEAGVDRFASLDALMAESDFVTIHLVLSPRTRGLIGAHELALMKPHAFLVNTSRGPIVDEAALIAALTEKRIAGAGLDVFDQEPLPAGHPFRTLPNVLATPHIGYVTNNNYRLYFEMAVEDIAAWLDGNPLRVVEPK